MTFKEFLGDIATAIREKTGETGKLKPFDFGSKIRNIVGGGGSATKTTLFTPTINIVNSTGELTITDENGGFVSYYSIYANGNYVASISGKTAKLTDYINANDPVLVKVCAVGNENFNNSEFSAAVWLDMFVGTEGLEYALSTDGTYYICKGIGTATDTDIVISQDIDKIPVTELQSQAFFKNANITSIKIPASITELGNNSSFNGCTSLKSVIFANGSRLQSINHSTFFGCKALNSITIPYGVVYISTQAFRNCTKLSSVTIPASVTSIMDEAFYQCSALKEITFGGTRAQWGAIELGTSWNGLSPLKTIHCTDGDITL